MAKYIAMAFCLTGLLAIAAKDAGMISFPWDRPITHITAPAPAATSPSPETATAPTCRHTIRKICKHQKTAQCEAVYLPDTASEPSCENERLAVIAATCGSTDAPLFETSTACISPEPLASCPRSMDKISAADIDTLYRCPALHASLCERLCGARYSTIDIRNFYQLDGKPGILCQDMSLDAVKKGVSLTDDPNRQSCLEVASGNYQWCINYNKQLNGVELGAHVACAGRIP